MRLLSTSENLHLIYGSLRGETARKQEKISNPENVNDSQNQKLIFFLAQNLYFVLTVQNRINYKHSLFAQIAQSVEQRTENPRVRGSIPCLGTIKIKGLAF